MNELQEQYGKRGLSIVGVTSESEAQTEPWIEKHGAKYPYAYDKSGKLGNALQVSGLPGAVLVDPSGTVVWKGHPNSLTEDLIEQHIQGASTLPPGIGALQELWGDDGAKVIVALQEQDFSKALKEAERVEGEKGEEILAAVQKRISNLAESLKALRANGDILGFLERAAVARKQLRGTPAGDAIDDLYKETRRDREAKKVLKVQEFVAKVRAKSHDARKRDDFDPLIGALEKMLAQLEGQDHFGIRQAEELLAQLRKSQQSMRR